VGAAGRYDQLGLAQLCDQVLHVGERQPLGLGNSAQRHRLRAGLASELDHEADPILGFGREQHLQRNPSELVG
jgi:hypothetical protein